MGALALSRKMGQLNKDIILEYYELNGSVKEPNISMYFFFIHRDVRCSISDVLFTGGREVSDFSVLKYY